MKQPNVTTAEVAATEKKCSRQAIYNALDRGDLTEVRIGGQRLILKDDAYEVYEVRETGGRTHEAYRAKPKSQ